MNSLFWEILRCPHVGRSLRGYGPCAGVVGSQGGAGQLSEPWVGRIEWAPLLFISSNPAFDPDEHFPTIDWSIRDVEEFFSERFHAGTPPYVRDFRVRLAAGGYAERAPGYWNEVHGCAADLFGFDRDEVRPGEDYALTEVVHCKSRDNEGTRAAARFCATTYLRRVLAASWARVVVCYGDIVWPMTQELFGLPPAPLPESRVGLFGPVQVEGHERWFLFLPQPNSNRPRKPSIVLPPEQLAVLRERLIARREEEVELQLPGFEPPPHPPGYP